ncbi:MAG: TIGR01244 family sulfur transferase [Rhodomicrobium sp.]
MELHKITNDLSVASQLDAAAIPLLAAQGFRAIICNRPDGEAYGQPDFRSVEQAAQAQGIRIIYMPVPGNAVGDSDAAAFGRALEELPAPVLAYCRSGTRCTVLWSLSQAGKRPIQEIVLLAMRAGYDMSALVPRLKKLQGT